jgi:7-cyano-7-deazaguanine synthase in queuosine biosynthesis
VIWNLIVNIGPTDTYGPPLEPTDLRLLIPIDHPTSPWHVGNDIERVLVESLGVKLTPMLRDLVRLSVAVYTADLRVPRQRSDDRWTREMILHLPVHDVKKWTKVRPVLHRLLDFLTGDHWKVELRELQSEDAETATATADIDAVCLFSGGLDSLVGAIDLLATGKSVALVSHHGMGDGTKSIQERVVAAMREKYKEKITHVPFFVHPDRGNTDEGENTMRGRSLLFMGVGVAVAASLKKPAALTVPENGLISLNVPLTSARAGSSSTRTTHPHYVALLRELLHGLGIPVTLDLPYRHMTKGEMLGQTADKATLASVVPMTMSCSHPTVGRYAGKTPGNHCGYCVPCIIRFASVKAAGVADRAPDNDVVKSPPAHTTGRGKDLRAFEIAVERLRQGNKALDLFRVLRTGPIPPEEAKAYAAVFRRGMNEVAAFLGKPL